VLLPMLTPGRSVKITHLDDKVATLCQHNLVVVQYDDGLLKVERGGKVPIYNLRSSLQPAIIRRASCRNRLVIPAMCVRKGKEALMPDHQIKRVAISCRAAQTWHPHRRDARSLTNTRRS